MKLLIVGHLEGQLIPASKLAQKNGAKVHHCPDIKSALPVLRDGKVFDLIFIDIEQDIKSFISALRSEQIVVAVIACGIKHDPKKAVEAIECGARDYLPLPPQDDLIAAIFESIASSDSDVFTASLSKKFLDLINIVNRIAKSDATILINGESGTGKEVIAKMIHAKSARSQQDFISLNCAAIPENLLESELFGHEKGSFTGAVERRVGKFESANGSTILLDEITEMDLRLQAKLLRVLQEREITRVGGNKVVKLDVRIIATSNRDMLSCVKAGTFREDLFYRLNVINITLPALRDRAEDIKALSEFFIKKYSKLNGIAVKYLTQEAIQKLSAYKWPGNIRELENAMHRTILLCANDEIEPEDLALLNEASNNNDHSMRTLDEIETDAIAQTLHHVEGDELKAAMILGISVRSLRDKLSKVSKVANN